MHQQPHYETDGTGDQQHSYDQHARDPGMRHLTLGIRLGK